MKTLKLLFAGIITVLSASNVSAQTVWSIEGVDFSVDTLYMATIGPGTTEIELRIESVGNASAVANNIFYTVTDLTDPYVEMRAAKGGNHVRKLEVVPEIAERMNSAGELYFAGVNADFFNMTYPYATCGSCVAGGYLTNFGSNYWAHIVFDENGLPTFVDNVSLQNQGVMRFSNGQSVNFIMNSYRGENDMVVYTPQWQTEYGEHGYTGTNEWGAEVQVRPVGNNILVGNTLQLEVIADPKVWVGNMPIPSDGYVISGHGTSRQFIADLKKGDKLTATIPFKAGGKNMKAKELLGGCPIILVNGQIQPQSNAIDHLKNKEPRTAVGHNADKTKLYMTVVDGRNAGGSAGVTQTQLAAIMSYIGCSDAMNFDGGGSSTMYVDGLGIRNIPSSSSLDQRPEGEPRSVVNSLFAVAVAPVDNNIASIEIREKKVSLSAGESFTPVVYGYNQYGVMVSSDLNGFSVFVPEQIGSVSGQTVTASDGHYSSLLTVDYNGLCYSVPVYINGGGEYISAGIADIEMDENVREEHYLINGVPVDAPQRGQITITRRGKTVTKEITR